MIEKCDGEILASRLWNEQRLAFQIRGQHKGAYWLSYFRMESGKVSEFERLCQLNDSVLRNLTLKVEPRLVDALVGHALGKVVAPTSDDEKTDTSSDESSEKADDTSEKTAEVEAK